MKKEKEYPDLGVRKYTTSSRNTNLKDISKIKGVFICCFDKRGFY
jgi:hypothetical protein